MFNKPKKAAFSHYFWRDMLGIKSTLYELKVLNGFSTVTTIFFQTVLNYLTRFSAILATVSATLSKVFEFFLSKNKDDIE